MIAAGVALAWVAAVVVDFHGDHCPLMVGPICPLLLGLPLLAATLGLSSISPNDPPPLTVAEVARRLRCSQRRVQRLIADHHLAAIQLGSTARTIRIEVAELERFIENGGIDSVDATGG